MTITNTPPQPSVGWLLERMDQWRDTPAMVWHDQTLTYGELVGSVKAWDAQLDALGVGHSQVVAIDGDFSPGTCALLLALVNRAAIVVPLVPAMQVHRSEFLETAEVEWVITFDAADQWSATHREVQVEHPLLRELVALEAPGLILFSSGSTGKNKAALHHFGRLVDKFKIERRRLVTLTFLLFDHIGGINTLFQTLSNGGTVVTTTSRDPEEICRLIERHRVELLPPSPTFLNRLLISEAHLRYDLSSLKWITYGTEVMPQSTLERLRDAFPAVRFKQGYGLSELGILRTQSKDDGSVWLKIGGGDTQIKVQDGTLWVRTPAGMLGYLNAPSPFDADGWLNTEDAVDVDGDWIRILGRRTDLINVGGNKVYPSEVEAVLLQMPNVRDATVQGERNPLMGQIVVATIETLEPEDQAALGRRVRAFCRERLAPHKVPVKVLLTEQTQLSPRYKKLRTG